MILLWYHLYETPGPIGVAGNAERVHSLIQFGEVGALSVRHPALRGIARVCPYWTRREIWM